MKHEVQDSIKRREAIILAADMNDDTTWEGKLHNELYSWGLRNIHQSIHPTLEQTAMCNKNKHEVAINGIWATPGIDATKAGMTGFG